MKFIVFCEWAAPAALWAAAHYLCYARQNTKPKQLAHSDNEELQWVPLDRKPNNELERIYTGAGWKLTRCQIRSQFGRTA
jgi:hypothetical protein